MSDLTDLQAAQTIKIIGADSSGVETSPVGSTANGALYSNLRDSSGNEVGPLQTQSGVNYLPVYLPLDKTTVGSSITTQDVASITGSGYAGQQQIIGTPTVGSVSTLAVGSIQTVMVEVTGIWTGTLSVEVSSDGGTLWVPRSIHVVGTAIFSANITSSVVGSLNASAKTHVRIRATSAITGTAVIRFIESDNPSNVYVANAVKLVDGSSVTSTTQMAIKAASTAAVATDTSVVVALNPGTAINLPTGASTSALQTSGNASLASIDSDIDVALSTRASSANQTNGTQTSRVTDGTNTASVKAASTAAAASDPALVVAISPNNTISATTNVPLTASSPNVASVGITSASAVAASATRKGLILCNNSINTIYIGIGATAVIGSGITLYPGGTFQMESSCLSTAAINAIATGAASSMSYQEFTT